MEDGVGGVNEQSGENERKMVINNLK